MEHSRAPLAARSDSMLRDIPLQLPFGYEAEVVVQGDEWPNIDVDRRCCVDCVGRAQAAPQKGRDRAGDFVQLDDDGV